MYFRTISFMAISYRELPRPTTTFSFFSRPPFFGFDTYDRPGPSTAKGFFPKRKTCFPASIACWKCLGRNPEVWPRWPRSHSQLTFSKASTQKLSFFGTGYLIVKKIGGCTCWRLLSSSDAWKHSPIATSCHRFWKPFKAWNNSSGSADRRTYQSQF